MKTNKQDIKHTINWNSKKIKKVETLSKDFIKHLNEKEIEDILNEDEEPEIGIVSERDIIEWLEKEKKESFWITKMKNHICDNIIKDDDDFFVGCDYEDFLNKYFFVASLWVTSEGKKIIILEYYH